MVININCRNAFSKLKKEFPDAFPDTLKLRCDAGHANLAERCGVMLTHMRRIANPRSDTRWTQCTKSLQDLQTTALEGLVMPLKEIITDTCTIDRSFSGVSSDTQGRSLQGKDPTLLRFLATPMALPIALRSLGSALQGIAPVNLMFPWTLTASPQFQIFISRFYFPRRLWQLWQF